MIKMLSRKIKINNTYLTLIALLLIFLLFFTFYSDMIISLPLFGDSATHGFISREIYYEGVNNVYYRFPPLYNVYGASLYSTFGEKGFNFEIIIGLFLICFSVFLLGKELTNNSWVGLLAVIVVLGSPKIIFYSARMYMEILISGLMVFSIFLFVKFLKDSSYKNLVLLAFFTGITASVKQQGLFILVPAILIALALLWVFGKRQFNFSKSISVKYLAVFICIFLFISVPPYLSMFKQKGKIIVGNENFIVIKWINEVGATLSGYKNEVKVQDWKQKWNETLNSIEREYYGVGTTRAEARHIWPTDVFTSYNKFMAVHSLYGEHSFGGKTTKTTAHFLSLIVVFGVLTFIFDIFKKRNYEIKKTQICFLIFLVIFLFINYFLFLRNTDQMRYHLFIPILFSVFIPMPLIYLQKLKGNYLMKKLIIMAFALIIVFLAFSIAYEDTKWNKRWYRSQLYSPSKGGIASVKEVGVWIQNNINETDTVWQMCGNELSYYSRRKVSGDWRFYFLNKTQLKEIYEDSGVEHIVIFDSQIVSDEKWINLCWIPNSFVTKLRNLYPQIYRSSFDDISVYYVGGRNESTFNK